MTLSFHTLCAIVVFRLITTHSHIFDAYGGDNHRREKHDVCTKFHLRIYKIISDVFALGQHRLDRVHSRKLTRTPPNTFNQDGWSHARAILELCLFIRGARTIFISLLASFYDWRNFAFAVAFASHSNRSQSLCVSLPLQPRTQRLTGISISISSVHTTCSMCVQSPILVFSFWRVSLCRGIKVLVISKLRRTGLSCWHVHRFITHIRLESSIKRWCRAQKCSPLAIGTATTD